jgi:hypothetical protein
MKAKGAVLMGMIGLARARAMLAGIGVAAVAVADVCVPASAQALVWSVVPSPSPSPTYNELDGVSCLSASACTAVGNHSSTGSGGPSTLIESWDGTGWSVVPSPSPSALGNFLYGVSCPSASACTAVGTQSTSSTQNNYATLIESWNGTGWSVVPSPNPGTTRNLLFGVSCVSATACTAVGDLSSTPNHSRTLIESWNGASWSVVPSPNPGSNDILGSVSCTSAAACTAVGSYHTRSSYRALIESWNGTGWSVVPGPRRGIASFLDGVSCVSASACTAVGSYTINGGSQRTLIESWNGTTWSVVSSPSRPEPVLTDVSCSSAAACTAVGYYNSGGASTKTLIESREGAGWSVVPSPSPGPSFNELYGVTCIAAGACSAVGTHDTSTLGQSKTLIESGSASR